MSAMRIVRCSYAVGAAAALLVVAGRARAQQIDTNPPLPNVLLMLDNSGSMERMIDGTLPEATSANTCNCVDPGSGAVTCSWSQTPVANRWNTVQTALTGTLQNGFNCVAMPRSVGSIFAQEYQINSSAPYDVGYYLPFHRIVAKDSSSGTAVACVMAPGSLPGASSNAGVGPPVTGSGAGGNATDFPPNAIVARQYGKLPSSAVGCTFSQNNDGAIGTTTTLMRFGMMTFDTDPGAGTGVTTGSNPQVTSPAFSGMWSYYPGWSTGGTATTSGYPAGCSTPTLMAVGARNPAAPPWEGRLVYFPTTNDLTAQTTANSHVQEIILASRPYGATPIAGMFTGAQYYFWNDPKGPQQTDGFVQGGCRPEYAILLTDGAPNLDLQPQCSQTLTGSDGGASTGQCPFALPQTTAATLYNNGKANGTNQFVTTFVIGFAVSAFQDQGTLVKCSQFAQSSAFSSKCDCSDPKLPQQQPYGACCELECIARAGGSKQAYFADTQGDLANALNTILATIAKNTTTRTTPAFSPVVTNVVADPNAPQTNSSIFLASFNPSPSAPSGSTWGLINTPPWSGDLQRQRYVCTYQGSGYTVPAPVVTPSAGDDFAQNLNSGSGLPRTFIAFNPDVESDGKTVDSSATIRPYATATVGDGLGKYSAKTYSGSASAVTGSVPTAAFGASIPAAGCRYTSTTSGQVNTLTSDACATMLLDYLFAQQSFSGKPADFNFVSRYGNAFGDIYHATPSVVGPPGSLLQDPLYVGFRQAWQTRKQIVYAATNDGLLHAFWADENKLENNELWAMVPPAVLPNLYQSYPASHYFLLDGAPITKDVVWDRNVATTDPAVWHTMLVAGYGPSYPGYYAVDVSNPDATNLGNGVVPADPAPPGPTFMWQLTKLPSSTFQVFGKYSATPAITTLFVDPGDGKGAREIGVAILPGGRDSSPSAVACARAAKTTDSAPPSGWAYRSSVRCWGANQKSTDPVNGRSLAIVRVDTGEILRVFARAADVPSADPLSAKQRITDTPLDSPMTVTPMPYPVDVGTDATKIFAGDEDGTIWKFDVSNSDPTKWTGELFLDLYNKDVDTNTTSWNEGQPMQVNPTLSLDTGGNLVLNVATGNTDQYDTNGIDLIYSVTEKVQGTIPKLRASVNWWLGPSVSGIAGAGVLHPGERVSGPMTVFNGVFYFATYDAGASNANACKTGIGRLWGRDFVTPYKSADLSQGGTPILQPPPPNPPQNPPPLYVQPSDYDSTLLGAVIPGVSIKATPACAGLGTPGTDTYVAGATHQTPNSFTAGSYSLFSSVGKAGSNGSSTAQIEMPVPTPSSPTTVDSWAAVLE